ncbi:PREDICTED: uncharacterized protein LOC100637034 [Amphimedon queenslandica]|uniref:Uncharacterized protein n=1 Tax=Amphimedon queenslandica TaxID=400682 RepID=A0A1X7V9J3_AMPQE|nr:PREDICTED: uncharacterized protein LOC100637034 [Amphimedon queenslandica]|eukprot:XP_003385245.1 PREDICTED: uncharacterized protein LOC100637034 [Amphimedon queenslandica]
MSDPASILVLGNKMREQIKELQERRAAAMMNEIADLQRERDIALSRLKATEGQVKELQADNSLLKEKCGAENDLKIEINALKQLCKEERLIANDLKKKLHGSEKKCKDLTLKLQAIGTGGVNSPVLGLHSPLISHLRVPLSKDKSQSMSDLSNRKNVEQASSQPGSPSLTPVQSPFSSPTFVPRRYKLSTVANMNQETQTDAMNTEPSMSPMMENLPRPVLEALASARDDLMTLNDQNNLLLEKLQKAEYEKKMWERKEAEINEKHKVLKEESDVLCESLSQFSQWVQYKLSSVEEEMDICKVIYSLHGSLSKDTQAIEEMRQKLLKSESSIYHLTSVNDQLKNALADVEIQLQESKTEAKTLREQLNKALTKKSSSQRKQISSLYSPLVRQKEKQNLTVAKEDYV